MMCMCNTKNTSQIRSQYVKVGVFVWLEQYDKCYNCQVLNASCEWDGSEIKVHNDSNQSTSSYINCRLCCHPNHHTNELLVPEPKICHDYYSKTIIHNQNDKYHNSLSLYSWCFTVIIYGWHKSNCARLLISWWRVISCVCVCVLLSTLWIIIYGTNNII